MAGASAWTRRSTTASTRRSRSSATARATGKPTAIICHSTKGYGAFSDFFNRHKVAVADTLLEQELALQSEQRRDRVEEFGRFYLRLERHPKAARRCRILCSKLARGCTWSSGPRGRGGVESR